MATIGITLPVPLGTAVGAPVATANMAGAKSVFVTGLFSGQLIIEVAAVAGGDFCQVATVGQPTKLVVDVACAQMRVRSQSVVGSPNVDVSAEEAVVQSAALTVPAASGVGAATDISAFGELTTVVVSPYTSGGTVAIELSEDGVNWVQGFPTFTGVGGCKTQVTPANFARVRRAGVTGGAPPTVGLAAVTGAGGGGIAIAEPRTCFVFRPGDPAGARENVYTDWPTLMAAVGNVQGCKTIEVDDSIVSPAIVPAGIWNVDDVLITSFIPVLPAFLPFSVLEFSDGASLVTPATGVWQFANINLRNGAAATGSPIVMASFVSLVTMQTVNAASLSASPLIDQTGLIALVELRRFSRINTVGFSPTPVRALAANGAGLLLVVTQDGSQVEDDAILSDVLTNLILGAPQYNLFGNQPNITGSLAVTPPLVQQTIGAGGSLDAMKDNIAGLSAADGWRFLAEAVAGAQSGVENLWMHIDSASIAGADIVDVRPQGIVKGCFRSGNQLHPEGAPGPIVSSLGFGAAGATGDLRSQLWRRMQLPNFAAGPFIGLAGGSLEFDEYCEIGGQPGGGPLIDTTANPINSWIYLGKRCRLHGSPAGPSLFIGGGGGSDVVLFLGEGAVVETDAISGPVGTTIVVVPLSSSFEFNTQSTYAGTIVMMPATIAPRHSDRATVVAAQTLVGVAGALHRISTAGGAVAVTLPLSNVKTRGQPITLKKTTGDASALSGTPSGADTIVGVASTVTAFGSLRFEADGEGAWHTTAVI
jgi:hypothetical protein